MQTDALAAELAALDAKATPGPWALHEYSEHLGYDCMTGGVRVGRIVLDGADYGQARCAKENETAPESMMADAALIAALRNNLPTILAALSTRPSASGEEVERVARAVNGLLIDFYCSPSYNPKAERPADNVAAAIHFTIAALRAGDGR